MASPAEPADEELVVLRELDVTGVGEPYPFEEPPGMGELLDRWREEGLLSADPSPWWSPPRTPAIARAAPEPEGAVHGQDPGDQPADDPVLACLRRVAAVLLPPRGADVATPAPDAAARADGALDLDFDVDVVEPEPALARAEATAREPLAARRAPEPQRHVHRPPRAAPAARTAPSVAARNTEPGVRLAASGSHAGAAVGPGLVALFAVAILAFTGVMLGLVAAFTGDAPPGSTSPAPAWGAGGAQGTAWARVGSAEALGAEAATRPPPVPEGPGAEHLARARILLEANRPDALGSTPEGAKQAEAEAIEAFRAGAAVVPGAWRTLAEVYDVGADWAHDPDVRADYAHKRRDALARALDAAPTDGEARLRYAMAFDEPGARILELERAVRDLPHDARPRRILGIELMTAGKVDEAAALLMDAAELSNAEDLKLYGRQVAYALQVNGHGEDAARVRERMKQFGYE